MTGKDQPQLPFVNREKCAAVNSSVSTSGPAPRAYAPLTQYRVFSTMKAEELTPCSNHIKGFVRQKSFEEETINIQ